MHTKKIYDWLFPGISLIMFASLLGAILIDSNSMGVPQLVSYSSGLLAYTMMLTVTFMGSRPRFIEKYFGMPEMYEIHALMGVVLSIMGVIHIAIQWNGFQWITDMSIVSQTGFLAVFSLIIVMFTGIFSLSGIFIDRNPTLRRWKESVFNREISLWLHRFSIVAIIAIYFHLFLLPFLNENTLFMTLLTSYTVLILSYYSFWKIKIFMSPKFVLKNIKQGTPSLWVLEFEPKKGSIKSYVPGDYFFIRFQNSDITTEGHPFSASSAITSNYPNSIEFMIKEAGDWTGSLKNVNIGDIATLEGPYGNFFPDKVKESDAPFILLAGGIGLTPNLSILRHQHENNSQRKIQLVWGLALEEDMFMLDELEAIKSANPNFSYHIIFSNEEVEGYPHGFISHEYLEEIGVSPLYQSAKFFVCGPPAMLNASKNLLDNHNVPDDNIYLDEFGF
ncbi:hypothetical protein HYQ40_00135 [Aerococcaceae bacterium DSM 111021]|nr:hypothetical protein [Aerococcaceae bacterium DSM 111021]